MFDGKCKEGDRPLAVLGLWRIGLGEVTKKPGRRKRLPGAPDPPPTRRGGLRCSIDDRPTFSKFMNHVVRCRAQELRGAATIRIMPGFQPDRASRACIKP